MESNHTERNVSTWFWGGRRAMGFCGFMLRQTFLKGSRGTFEARDRGCSKVSAVVFLFCRTSVEFTIFAQSSVMLLFYSISTCKG